MGRLFLAKVGILPKNSDICTIQLKPVRELQWINLKSICKEPIMYNYDKSAILNVPDLYGFTGTNTQEKWLVTVRVCLIIV